MKIPVALMLCFSVLLSGCISANTAMFTPEPDSGGDTFTKIWGGIWNLEFFWAIPIIVASVSTGSFGRKELSPEQQFQLTIVAVSATLATVGIFSADIAIRNSLPYRKAYYERKQKRDKQN